jgi:hypothetical protein
MEIQRLAVDQALRFHEIRLHALADAPDAFGSAYAEVAAHPPERWSQQLREIATFISVLSQLEQKALDRIQQRRVMKRFRKESITDRRDLSRFITISIIGRHGNDGNALQKRVGFQEPDRLDALKTRQLSIHENQVGQMRFGLSHAIRPRRRFQDLIVQTREYVTDNLMTVPIIIHDENLRHDHSYWGSTPGLSLCQSCARLPRSL